MERNLSRCQGLAVLGEWLRFPLAWGPCWMQVVIRVAILALLFCHEAAGGVQSQIALPPAGKKIKNGLIGTIESYWVQGTGYRPVRITLRSSRTTSDRKIRVKLCPGSYYRSMRSPHEVWTELTIPQGTREGSVTVSVPDFEMNSYWLRVDFFEDGAMLRDLSMDQGEAFSTAPGMGGQGVPAVLLLDRDAPLPANRQQRIADLQLEESRREQTPRSLPNAGLIASWIQAGSMQTGTTYAVDNEANRLISDSTRLSSVNSLPYLELIPPRAIPPDLMAYTGIDLVIISVGELSELQKQDPARFGVLQDYVRTGGNLIVFQATKGFEDASSLLGISSPWEASDKELFRRQFVFSNGYNPYYGRGQVYGGAVPAQVDVEQDEGSPPVPPPDFSKFPEFRRTSLGLGQVVVVASDDFYAEDYVYLRWVLNSFDEWRMTSYSRLGTTIQNDATFWQFLIPGVGATPVVPFLATITLFTLVVGPLNYSFLRARKRLYLLPLTVGGAAMITVLAMTAYALIHDGITTRVRLRSVTELDQVNHVVSSQCRHAYFATMVPRSGLVFPDQVGVVSISPTYDYRRKEEALDATSQTRQFRSGYLRPRSVTQFIAKESHASDAGLKFLNGEGGIHSSTEVLNQLGVPIQECWVVDEQGNVWSTGPVDDGATTALRSVTVEEATRVIGKYVGEHELKLPDGVTNVNQEMLISIFGSWNTGPNNVPVLEGIIERKIEAARTFPKRARYGTYLVICTQAPPFLSVGTEASETASFHLIHGTWRKP